MPQNMGYEEGAISDAMSSVCTEVPFRNILSGEKAFYNQPDYLEATKQDWLSSECLPVSYTWNTEHKVIRIVKKILSTMISLAGIYTLFRVLSKRVSLKQPLLALGTYKLLQHIAGIPILPSAIVTTLMRVFKAPILKDMRSDVSLTEQWKYKRISIEVDGDKIDSVIFGTPSTLDNGRWLLLSSGNGEVYEDKLLNDSLKQTLHKFNSNALVFNYPGVGSSSGLASKPTMVKAYRAMLNFLEDKEKGIGAKEIIGYGFSIGGATQGEALKTHPLKEDVKYVFIKDRTFSTLSQLVSLMMGRFLGFAVKCLGWEMDSMTSSRKLQAPEIILQKTRKEDFHQVDSVNDLEETDGIIKKKGSLAFGLLQEGIRKNKYYLGITANHNSPLDAVTIEHLSEIVNQALAEDR